MSAEVRSAAAGSPPRDHADGSAVKADSRTGWLTTLNPVATLLACIVPMLAVTLTRDWQTPALVAAGAAAGILTGVRLRPRTVAWAALGAGLFTVWTTVLFGLLVRPDLVAGTPVVVGRLHAGAVAIGAATALRMLAVMLLALLGSVGSTTDRFVSALVCQCRVPYRFAHGTAAALRFVPRYQEDLATLRAAHRTRGIVDPPGPVGYLRRTGRSLVPLLAGGARHAQRLSLAMDARGFGAHPRRTDRNPARLRARDGVVVAGGWLLTAAAFAVTASLGLLRIAGSPT